MRIPANHLAPLLQQRSSKGVEGPAVTELARRASVAPATARRVLRGQGHTSPWVADRLLYAAGRSLAELPGYLETDMPDWAWAPSEESLHVDPAWRFWGAADKMGA